MVAKTCGSNGKEARTNATAKTRRAAIGALLCLAACLMLLPAFAQSAAFAGEGSATDASDTIVANEADGQQAGQTSSSALAADEANVAGKAALAEVVTYVDENGIERDCTDPAWIDGDSIRWNSTVADGWYAVPQGADIQISKRVNIEGDVCLILTDGCRLTAAAGISILGNGSLTVYAQRNGTGLLYAGDGCVDGDAGIYCAEGTLIVCGGTVEAHGGNRSAGIGGGYRSDTRDIYMFNGGTVIVKNGYVKGYGGNQGAGIGGGYACQNGGTVIVSGGRVEGHGTGYEAYGIGRGAAGAYWADVTIADTMGAWDITKSDPVQVWPHESSKAKAGAIIRLVKDVLIAPLSDIPYEEEAVPSGESEPSAAGAGGSNLPPTGDSTAAGAAACSALAILAAALTRAAARKREQ